MTYDDILNRLMPHVIRDNFFERLRALEREDDFSWVDLEAA